MLPPVKAEEVSPASPDASTMRVGLVMLLLLACAGCDSDERARPGEARSSACAPGTWGAAELDALYPALLEQDASVLLGSPSAGVMAERLELAARSIPAALSPRARVALQNDAWGMVERVEASEESSANAAEIAGAGRALVRALAPSAEEVRELAGEALPATARRVLPAAEGWRERGSEMPVLSHERLFRLRRIFRVLEKPGGRALVSQLVALDRDGEPQLTDVIGEIEVLAIDPDGSQRGDRVLHLDRRGLRCEGAGASLEEVLELAHLPGDGADGLLVELSPPVAVRENPCARCHERGEAPMSLPSDAVDPADRIRRLLHQRSGM